jgi:hypothetical protein
MFTKNISYKLLILDLVKITKKILNFFLNSRKFFYKDILLLEFIII